MTIDDRRNASEAELFSRISPYVSDRARLHRALVHRSYCAEVPNEQSNERLEFLGDAVLQLVVTDYLYGENPQMTEGDLTRVRAAVVSERTLAPVASRLGVGEALYLGRGEESSGGRAKSSLLADALESIIGASYLDVGLPMTHAFVLELLSEVLAVESRRPELGDAKNRLQELASRSGLEAPRYDVVARGPDHAREFVVTVHVGPVNAKGEGRSKKAAERAAAEAALVEIEVAGSSA